MKATGIVRRIDDLGRVVIPKEIRKNLRIKEGDNLEIYVQNNQVILEKHSVMNKISDVAQGLVDAIYTFMKYSIFITDTDSIIAGAGKLKKELLNYQISDDLLDSIKRREKILESHIKKMTFAEGKYMECSYVLNTILANGEAVGVILIISEDEKLKENEMQVASIVSSFVSKYLEQ